MQKQKLFAFWRYDLFPYILGGEVEKIREDGKVFIKSYEHWFKPILIVPKSTGELLLENFQRLKNEFNKEINELRKEKITKMTELYPPLSEFFEERNR